MNPPALGVYNISSVYGRPRRKDPAKHPDSPGPHAHDADAEEALIDALADRIMARLDRFSTTGPPIRLAAASAEQLQPTILLQQQQQPTSQQQQLAQMQRDDGVWIAIIALACLGLAMFFVLMSRMGRLETAVTTSQWMTMMRFSPMPPTTT